MKIKKLFAFMLSLILAFGAAIPAFAYSDSVITGQYLDVGDTHITGADPDTVSLYYFKSSTIPAYGVYRVTVTGEGAHLRSYCGTVGYRYDNTDETDYDEETNSYSFTVYTSTEKRLIGVTGAEEFDISIRKTERIVQPECWNTSTAYSSIAPSYTDDKFNILPAEGAELKYVDLTVPHTVYRDIDNHYHLDSKDGPILYMNMISPPYIDLYAMANSGILKYALFSEGMTGYAKYRRNYSNLYLEYAFSADPELGILPLNPQLVTLLQEMGKAKGWYEKDLEFGYYLFGDTLVDKDSAWMFPLCYFEEPDAIQMRDGSEELPYTLLCDDYNGSFCVIKSQSSSFYKLDVSNGAEVACMAFNTSTFNGYIGFKIAYGDNTYTPEKDGLLSFKLDGSSDTIEVINSGTRDAIFILALTSAAPVGDGSAEYPHTASFGSENSIVQTVDAGEMIFVLTETSYNATAEIFALDENFNYSTEFLVYHSGEYFYLEPDIKTNLLSLELNELDNFYLIYNYSEKPLTFYASLSKTDASLSDLDGSASLPYILYCDPYDFSSYTIAKEDSIHFRTNYPDGTYVIATAVSEDPEMIPDLSAIYDGKLHCPNASGVLIFPLSDKNDTFEILNSSKKEIYLDIAVVSDISFQTPEGSYENPIASEIGEYTAEITDSTQGHVYYSYTAEKDAILSFEIDTAQSEGWVYTLTNATTGYSTSHVFSDRGESTCKIGVSEGDTVIIAVGTYDEMHFWQTPEGEVSWSIDLSDPVIGDINFDGEINAKDSNLLKRMIAGASTVKDGTVLFLCSNTNRDGDVSAKDSNLLKRYLSGAINNF